MPTIHPNDRAELIESIHQPWKATLGSACVDGTGSIR
jgi:hypothetical protein